ncbi:MAG TPA: universal stress protein [Gemmatimonadales bacterium]|nr:universal stress protein [Gemmatimonadales bacterium]
MVRGILIPLDGSDAAEQALPVAERLARRTGAPLHLATVFVPPEAAELEEEARRRLETYMECAGDAARSAHGLAVTTAVLTGAPAVALAHHARIRHADLVVMTTHGRGGLSRWWLGSVADRLLRRTTVPVLLLPLRSHAQPIEFHRILVALSGEAGDDAVVEHALALAAPACGATLRLVRVVPASVPMLGPLPAYPTPRGPDWAGRLALEARTALARTSGRLDGCGVRVTTEVVASENIAEAVLHAADAMSADLIAVGSHGAGAVERLILGSVADKVIRGAGRPVLVVPMVAD